MLQLTVLLATSVSHSTDKASARVNRTHWKLHPLWPCKYEVVLQPFVDILVTPIPAGFWRPLHLTGCQTGGVTALDSHHESSHSPNLARVSSTLGRLVGALVHRLLWGGSLIHAAFLYLGPLAIACCSISDERLVAWTLFMTIYYQ